MCQGYDSIVPRCLDALYRTGYRMANRIMANGLVRRDGGGLSAMNTDKGMVTLVGSYSQNIRTRVPTEDRGKDSGQKLMDVSYRSAAGLCNPSQVAATIRA
jgi:hypothetical protein